ncbi:MAG: hypothetical protein M3Y07_06610 [Acidobacteriota bacterium]|nr:hypothetical protein [Acidobacteriota bacterium]
MKINIETIPHETQRYPTVGDYWEDATQMEQVRVSEMPDWRYEALVAVHELVEMILGKHRGIAEEAISDFDIEFEKSREAGKVLGEPGDDSRAPYRKEHFFATNVERLLAAELGVDWFAYERLVDGLGVKK